MSRRRGGASLPALAALAALRPSRTAVPLIAGSIKTKNAPERNHGIVPIGLWGALLLGVSYGYWFHATESEDQIIANGLLAGAFALLAAIMARRGEAARGSWRGAGLGILGGLAVLSHATAVLFLPALIVGLLIARTPWRSLAVFVLSLGAVIGLPYAFVGFAVHRFHSLGDFGQWASSAPRMGVWGRGGLRNLFQAAETLSGSVVYSPNGPQFKALLSRAVDPQNLLAVAAFAAILLIVAASIAHVVGRWRQFPARGFAVVSLLWAGSYAAFGIYWAPEDLQFWIGLLPALILLFCLVLAHIMTLWPRWRHPAGAVLYSGLLLVAVYNFGAAIQSRSDLMHNEGYAKAVCLKEHTTPRDLIISPGWDWTSSYVPYFAQREVFSIVDSYLLASDKDAGRLQENLQAQIAATRQNGGRVFVVRLYALDDNDLAWLRQTTGLTPADFAYTHVEAWRCAGETAWEIQP